MKIVRADGGRVTVRGGGLSSNHVADDAVMLDLSVHMAAAWPHQATVSAEGGSTVGTVPGALAPAGRVIPVGIVAHAGFGLITRGRAYFPQRAIIVPVPARRPVPRQGALASE